MAARRSSTLKEDERRKMLHRIDELERRVDVLERRVLRDAAEARVRNATPVKRSVTVVGKKPVHDGPSCPGCTMPIDKDYKEVECAWCGFRLDVIEAYRKRLRSR